jgi:nicotinate-nucleotide adenylyltransferase
MSGIGILGGSFDPVHLAHLVVAERVREELALERVLLVPAARQPLKAQAAPAPAADRLAMLELALAGNRGLRADPLELERGGVSYMADTLAELARRAEGTALFLILGSDAYRSLASWRRPAEVRRLARIVVVPRAADHEDLSSGSGGGGPLAAGDLFVAAPLLDISASDIRARVARGASIRYLVPEGVRAYIETRGLYRSDEGRTGRPPAGAEPTTDLRG